MEVQHDNAVVTPVGVDAGLCSHSQSLAEMDSSRWAALLGISGSKGAILRPEELGNPTELHGDGVDEKLKILVLGKIECAKKRV